MSKRVTSIQKGKQEGNNSLKNAMRSFLLFKKAEKVSETTIKDYQQHIKRFFNRYPNSWEDQSLLKDSAIDYLSDDIKPATYNLRLIYLRAFFNWCIDEGYLEVENPMSKFKNQKAEPRVVDIPEDYIVKLLKLPNQKTFAGLRDYALILFTMDTGARPKEAMSLRIENFDLDYLTVVIPADMSKTKRNRTLPILPPTAEAISRLISARHSSWSDETPVFCSYEGKKLSRYSWRDRLKKYSDELGVKITPYSLRHCFSIMYLRNGGNVFGLQETLGHTDISMTRRYVRLTRSDMKNIHKTSSPLNRLMENKSKRVRNL